MNLFSIILFFYIRSVISKPPSLTYIMNSYELTGKLENSINSVLFITDNEEQIKFAHSTIEIFKDKIQFLLGLPKDFPEYYNENPTIIFFKKTKKCDWPHINSKNFSIYCDRMLNPYVKAGISDIRSLFHSGKTFIAEVDISESNFRETELETVNIYKVNSSTLHRFNLSVDGPGLYFYRPEDRQFIRYDKGKKNFPQTRLTHYTKIPENTTKMIISFVVDSWGVDCSKYLNLLEELSHMYGNVNYYYTLIHPSETFKFFKGSGIFFLKPPYFIVSNISCYPAKKFIYNETVDGKFNSVKLKKFILDVLSKKKKPFIASEKINDYEKNNSKSFNYVANSNFDELVMNEKHPCAVYFRNELLDINQISDFVFLSNPKNESRMKFFVFDVLKNDIPFNYPELKPYPVLITWDKDKKEPKDFEYFDFDFNEYVSVIDAQNPNENDNEKSFCVSLKQSLNETINSSKYKVDDLMNKEVINLIKNALNDIDQLKSFNSIKDKLNNNDNEKISFKSIKDKINEIDPKKSFNSFKNKISGFWNKKKNDENDDL